MSDIDRPLTGQLPDAMPAAPRPEIVDAFAAEVPAVGGGESLWAVYDAELRSGSIYLPSVRCWHTVSPVTHEGFLAFVSQVARGEGALQRIKSEQERGESGAN